MMKKSISMRLLSVLLVLLMAFQSLGFVLAEEGDSSENLALGATLTVSSNNGGAWDKSLLNDGVTLGTTAASGWSSQKVGVGTSATEPAGLPVAVTATFDFGTKTTFNQWKLYPRNHDLTVVRLFPIGYTVQVSDDNATWTTVATVTDGDVPVVVTDPAVVTLDQAVSGQYVKFIFTKINLPDTWKNNLHVQLTELEIFNVERFSCDIDGDASTDSSDVIALLNHFNNGAAINADVADVNGDGKISLADALNLLKKLSA